eukprot:2120343-Rhodomonas_salina.4
MYGANMAYGASRNDDWQGNFTDRLRMRCFPPNVVRVRDAMIGSDCGCAASLHAFTSYAEGLTVCLCFLLRYALRCPNALNRFFQSSSFHWKSSSSTTTLQVTSAIFLSAR